MVSTPVAIVNPLPNVVGSLIPTLSQGHGANEDPVTSVEHSESTLEVDKGKQPTDESSQCKKSGL